MIYELLLLLLGLVGLVIGTELIIRGAINIARHYKLSNVFIGLTILSVGTNLPELVLSIISSLNTLSGTDSSGLLMGNAIGSCFGQLGFVLGILGIFYFFTLTKKEIRYDGFMLLISLALLFFVSYDGMITRKEGLSLLLVYLIYYVSLFREQKIDTKIKRAPVADLYLDIISFIGGFTVVIYSSNVVVESAINLAVNMGISQTVIGILIVGIGTSLPEFAVSIGAALRGEKGLSIGNLIGSNIFDTLVLAGVGGTVSGVMVDKGLLTFDLPMLFLLSVAVLFFFRFRKGLQKTEAIFLLAFFFIYAVLKAIGYPY